MYSKFELHKFLSQNQFRIPLREKLEKNSLSAMSHIDENSLYDRQMMATPLFEIRTIPITYYSRGEA